MVDAPTIAIEAARVGYRKYGASGAVSGVVLAGGSVIVAQKLVSRYTDADEDYIMDTAERIRKDEELNDIVKREFSGGVELSVEKIEELLEEYLSDDSG
jgi:hypothetical protein